MRRPVQDEDGNRYLLLKRSGESSLVREVETGEQQYLPNENLTEVEEESTVETIVSSVPGEIRTLLTGVHDERALALVLELDADGPLAVRTLLSAYEFCESDLHGLLGELQAGGLIEERSVAGERGYATTETATRALSLLRNDSE